MPACSRQLLLAALHCAGLRQAALEPGACGQAACRAGVACIILLAARERWRETDSEHVPSDQLREAQSVQHGQVEDVMQNAKQPWSQPFASTMHGEVPRWAAFSERWWKCLLRGWCLRCPACPVTHPASAGLEASAL